jgi:hypothetical protein
LGKQKAEMLYRFASLQCCSRELRIFGKVFHSLFPLFPLFAPVQVLWLQLAALRLRDLAALR